MQPVNLDHDLVKECFAVVYTPKRQRTRFPENCVRVFSSLHEAIEKSDPDKHYYPAKVIGPSRSSEGFRLYYLIHWLD